jgi:hypothetical protein
MGWGDFGSNGSVHWRIHYHDNRNKPGTPPVVSGIDDNKKHPHSPLRPSIGEMHEIDERHEMRALEGRQHSHPGEYRVIARYETPEKAFNAALKALIDLFKDQDEARRIVEPLKRLERDRKNVIIDVGVADLRHGDAAFDPPEVTVEW